MHVNGILSDEILFNHKTKKPMAPLRVSKNLHSSVLPNFKTDVRMNNNSVGGGANQAHIAALSNSGMFARTNMHNASKKWLETSTMSPIKNQKKTILIGPDGFPKGAQLMSYDASTNVNSHLHPYLNYAQTSMSIKSSIRKLSPKRYSPQNMLRELNNSINDEVINTDLLNVKDDYQKIEKGYTCKDPPSPIF